jgi:hypothetical protein
MSTYKVIQDIEAEDKLLGPLTLRQFVYAGIAVTCGYLIFLSIAKNVPFMIILLAPVMIFTGFFAFPWGKDQPTEVWALAKVRFFLKPRRRLWSQSGIRQVVSITVPKKIERVLTNGLDQHEVRSRLSALASTIDSRGWAVKNVAVNLSIQPYNQTFESSDRLVGASMLPQEVSSVDVRASDDILDEYANPIAQNFSDMIVASSQARHQDLITLMQQPTSPTSSSQQSQVSDPWFMQQPQTVATQQSYNAVSVAPQSSVPLLSGLPQAANPTPEEQAMVAKFKAENSSQSISYGHMKVIKTPEEVMADQTKAAAIAAETAIQQKAQADALKTAVTPGHQAVIINLARSNDLNVETLARQAQEPEELHIGDNNEVIISLHKSSGV